MYYPPKQRTISLSSANVNMTEKEENEDMYSFWDGFRFCTELILLKIEGAEPEVDLEKAAEKYALKTFPKEEGKAFHSYFGTIEFDKNASMRTGVITGFIAGAKWQEKQDELTWKDLQKIDIIANEVWQDGKYDKNDAQVFYTEVLKRFKEYKRTKKQ